MNSPDESRRADVVLVQQGFAKSRTEAQSAIRSGHVRINGETLRKVAQILAPDAAIEYVKPHPYVSRGALKLAAALDHFPLPPENRVCLDVGASTGGFTEVLLERGARRVYAIDVGHGQLAPKLRNDPRVTAQDGVNARELSVKQIPEHPQAVVIDVSFIGLKLALPPSLSLAASGAWLVALVKPQFEVGKFAIGKGGVVKDEVARDAAVDEVTGWIDNQSAWKVLGRIESPITGGDGNQEFLVAAQKT